MTDTEIRELTKNLAKKEITKRVKIEVYNALKEIERKEKQKKKKAAKDAADAFLALFGF